MAFFPEYHPDARGFDRAYRHICHMGWVPLGLAMALLYAHEFHPGPGVWGALGITLALLLILRGLRMLPRDLHRSPIGDWLNARSDHWIPMALFATKYTFFNLNLIMIWLTLHGMGFPSMPWQHILFVLVVLLLPARRFADEWVRTQDTKAAHILFDLSHYLLMILITAVIGSFLAATIVSQSEPFQTDTDPLLLIIWVITIALIFLFLVLMIARLKGEAPEKKKTAPTPSTTKQDRNF